ncbi:hypothetical protein LWI28_001626 [Acer negundo]|uniref:Uncharacterized protein n=1 Tax=Acer negundo TaxID=4023 RepID=A0AAD5P539_ACENE|nr:hypothetical protein LWI28_001626 [Acer negundo]
MLRKYTNMKELLKHAKTRFATAFITLSRIHSQKPNLRMMFNSYEWAKSKQAKEMGVERVAKVMLMPSFWNNVVFSLKIASPLVGVLRLVDGERKPLMGYIYEATDRAKNAIAKSFEGNENIYEEIFKLIDNRWNIQLYRLLYGDRWYLNSEFFYNTKTIDEEVATGLFTCKERLAPDVETRCKIDDELSKYKRAEALFGNPMILSGGIHMAFLHLASLAIHLGVNKIVAFLNMFLQEEIEGEDEGDQLQVGNLQEGIGGDDDFDIDFDE